VDIECFAPGEHSIWPASRKETVRSVFQSEVAPHIAFETVYFFNFLLLRKTWKFVVISVFV